MKPRPILTAAIAVLAVVATAAVAVADQNGNFVAPLNNEEEIQTPAVVSNAAGAATVQLSTSGDTLSYRLIVANIDNVLFSHIHCGPAGANGPVVAFLYPGPTVTTNGVLAQGTIADPDVIDRPDSASCPGGVADFGDLLEKIRSGGAYVNVHTVVYPAGEIRGQIR